MSDSENRWEERRRQREERHRRREERYQVMRERWNNPSFYRSQTRSSIWTGVFLLLIGLAALIKVSNPDLPHWVFGWQTFLIALGIFIGVRHRFRGPAWFILILVGGVFLANEINPDLTFRRYVWPLVLIVFGMFLILRPRHRRFRGAVDDKVDQALADPAKNEDNYSKEDFIDSTSVFGGVKKNIISKNFKGGDIVNIFGGTELNLMQADFTGTAIIEISTTFGGTKLIVPANWSVKSEVVMIFGGMEDKRNIQTITDKPDKTLLLRGTVIFGGIDIKSF